MKNKNLLKQWQFWIAILVAGGIVFLIIINDNTVVSKVCEENDDCIVFGEDGDCNCGCYHKDALPQNTGGKCFCAAPISCECINNICEGVWE